MEIGKYKGYSIFLSDKPDKKYFARVGNRKIYFGGDPRHYEHYHDKMDYYKHLNHNDPKRRKNFKARHEKYRHVVGSAAWFSDQILW